MLLLSALRNRPPLQDYTAGARLGQGWESQVVETRPEPASAGVPTDVNADSVVALDVANGQLRWRFFTGGPVRFAPAAWRDRLFVASDDGCLYALALQDGRLLWKHRGGPNGRMCLGNGRLISRWPARGGPVVLEDALDYAAGIWPSDGVYLYALDAASGAVCWSSK
jgi:outer membrane protein assembly factor BamB